MEATNLFKFISEPLGYAVVETETKSGKEKEYHIQGYIATSDRDLVGDVVTRHCMEGIVAQCKAANITLDYEHETMRDPDKRGNIPASSTIIPVGKIVDARLDKQGVWVDAILNPASPKFEDLWVSVKGGFINGFSITYHPLKVAHENINGQNTRLLDEILLRNAATTGNAINPSASITDFGMKAVMMKSIAAITPPTEVKPMENKPEAPSAATAPAPATPAPVSIAPAAQKSQAESEAEQKALTQVLAEMKSMNEKLTQLDALKKENAELKAKLEAPVMKSLTPTAPPSNAPTAPASVLASIR